MEKISLETIESYYSKHREPGKNIYDLWEEGKAYNDSVTPATYDPQYQKFITQKIESLLDFNQTRRILSIGCGNAFVERALHEKGYFVIANDVNKDAVELAQRKGLQVVWADVEKWEPTEKNFTLIYGDGVMGHLYNSADGLNIILSRLKSWLSDRCGTILISNDPATIDAPMQPHPVVQGFYWFSAEYLCSELLKAGFKDVESENFVYHRPLSGKRNRLIVKART